MSERRAKTHSKAPGRLLEPRKPRAKGLRLTPAQELLRTHLLELNIQTEPEIRVVPDRQFRFDLADTSTRTGYECDGGQWSGGHMRGKKLETQYEKDRLAQLHGWRIFRFTNRQVLTGEALAWLRTHLL